MRQVEIAAEVAAELGAEQVARLTDGTWDERVQCWDCGGWIEAAEPAAVLLLETEGTGPVRFGTFAHPSCGRSEIRAVSAAEMAANKAAAAQDPEDTGSSLDAVATVWPLGESAYPVVLFSYRGDVLRHGGPERQDGLVAALLEHGWHLVTTLDTADHRAGPAGYRLRFTHEQPNSTAPGLLELINPHGQVETTVHIQPAGYWRPALVRTGRAMVVHGSRYLGDWASKGRRAVKHAARAGSLVGGIVPVELVGPGNNYPG